MAGMRRSEVSALHWADVADAADGDGVLVTVRRSKTNQEGETTDVRFVKGGVARAIRGRVRPRVRGSRVRVRHGRLFVRVPDPGVGRHDSSPDPSTPPTSGAMGGLTGEQPWTLRPVC